jgi:SAV_6107-like HEPN
MPVDHATAPVPAASYELLQIARRGLVEAGTSRTPAERYATAHLAALRAAAAVLACRMRPGSGRRGPRSVWVVLPEVAPELGEWAAFFAAGAGKRAAAEAGLPAAVSTRDSDDLLRDATAFLALVEATLGLSHQPFLPSTQPAFPLVG